jgi:hypothetical protein
VWSVLLRYTDNGCLPLVSSNSSYRIYKKKLIKLPTFTEGIFCQFSHYYWGTLHNCLFFSIKTDDETTILVVYDIYFINQLPKYDNNKNKQTKNKQIKNKQEKKQNKAKNKIKKKLKN